MHACETYVKEVLRVPTIPEKVRPPLDLCLARALDDNVQIVRKLLHKGNSVRELLQTGISLLILLLRAELRFEAVVEEQLERETEKGQPLIVIAELSGGAESILDEHLPEEMLEKQKHLPQGWLVSLAMMHFGRGFTKHHSPTWYEPATE